MATGYEHSLAAQICGSYNGGQLSAENTARLVTCCRALLDEHHRMIRAICAIEQVWPAVKANLNELHKLTYQNVDPRTRKGPPPSNPGGRGEGGGPER